MTGRGATAARSGSRVARRSTGAAIRRAMGLMAFLPLASRMPMYARLIVALLLDDRTPGHRKAMLAGAAGYLLLGRDVVPDDLPVVGGLDDLVVVALAVDLFLDGVPGELLTEKLDELGIDRAEYDRDVAQLRRFMPGPVRRTIRRIPSALGTVGDAVQSSGIVPRVRKWIDKEDSPA